MNGACIIRCAVMEFNKLNGPLEGASSVLHLGFFIKKAGKNYKNFGKAKIILFSHA
jgi:hypothetical protein